MSCKFAGGRRDDEEVLKNIMKNKSFIDRSLYSTVRSDRRHGLNTISRCAYDLAGIASDAARAPLLVSTTERRSAKARDVT